MVLFFQNRYLFVLVIYLESFTTTQILLHRVSKWGFEAVGLVARLVYSRQGSQASRGGRCKETATVNAD